MIKSAEKHLAAIESGKIERGNVIGLRKLINASERKARRWSIGVTAAAVSLDDLDTIESAIARCRPVAVGELHEGGLAVLRNPKYKNRLADYAESIAAIDHFRLVRFDRLGSNGVHSVPVFQVWAKIPPKGDALDGGTYLAFTFRNIPWQSGGNGPEIEGKDF